LTKVIFRFIFITNKTKTFGVIKMKYKLTAYCKPTLQSPAGLEIIYFTVRSNDIQVIIDSMLGRDHLRFVLTEE
jgi:hypothetical protein